MNGCAQTSSIPPDSLPINTIRSPAMSHIFFAPLGLVRAIGLGVTSQFTGAPRVISGVEKSETVTLPGSKSQYLTGVSERSPLR